MRASGDDLLVQVLERRARARHGALVAGVDEAGRGPLAGPVLVGAVVLPADLPGVGDLADSKLLSAAERERLARWVRRVALGWALWRVGPRAIDGRGIAWAVRHAMVEAVRSLPLAPGAVLVDGPVAPAPPGTAGLAVVDGDRICASVMAAAILAKTARDREMLRWNRLLPGYAFDRHKGYATAQHLEALARIGPSPIHRQSFLGGLRPVGAETGRG